MLLRITRSLPSIWIVLLVLLQIRYFHGVEANFSNWTCGINKFSQFISYIIALPCEIEVNDCCFMHDRCYEIEHDHPLLYWQSDCDDKFCRCLKEVSEGRLWCRPIMAPIFCAAVRSFGHKTYALHRFADST